MLFRPRNRFRTSNIFHAPNTGYAQCWTLIPCSGACHWHAPSLILLSPGPPVPQPSGYPSIVCLESLFLPLSFFKTVFGFPTLDKCFRLAAEGVTSQWTDLRLALVDGQISSRATPLLNDFRWAGLYANVELLRVDRAGKMPTWLYPNVSYFLYYKRKL